MESRVDQEVFMEQVHSDGTTNTVRTCLGYDPADPYAVHVTFFDGDESLTWTFARDLLDKGQHGPHGAGIGDVAVWPYGAWLNRYLVLALDAPDGQARFLMPRQEVAAFLARTYKLVPRGSESDHLDVDRAIKQLLSGRSSSDT